jgi:Na+/H+-translocating membrane pyrophosphatase
MIELLVPLVGLVGLFYAFTLFRETTSGGHPDTPDSSDLISIALRSSSLFAVKLLRSLWVVVLSAYLFLHFVVGFETAVSYLLGAGSALATLFSIHFLGLLISFAPTTGDVRGRERMVSLCFASGLSASCILSIVLGVLYFSFDSLATVQSLLGFGLGASQTVLLSSFCSYGLTTNEALEEYLPDLQAKLSETSSNVLMSFLAVLLAVMLMGRSIVIDEGVQFIFIQTPFVMGVLGIIASIIAFHLVTSRPSNGNNPRALDNVTQLAAILFMGASLLFCGFGWLFFGTLGVWHWLAIASGSLSYVLCSGGCGLYGSMGKGKYSCCKYVGTWCSGLPIGQCSIGGLLPLLLVLSVSAWCGGELEGLYCVGLALVAGVALCPVIVANQIYRMTERAVDLKNTSSNNPSSTMHDSDELNLSILVAPLVAMFLAFVQSKQSFRLVQTLGYFSWLQITLGVISIAIILQCLVRWAVRGGLKWSEVAAHRFADQESDSLAMSDVTEVYVNLGANKRSELEYGRLFGLFAMLIPICVVVVFGADVLTGNLLGLLAIQCLTAPGRDNSQAEAMNFESSVIAKFSLVFFFVSLLSLPLVV